MQGGGANVKKEEKDKPKEEPKKPTSFQDKIKNMQGGEASKKPEKEPPKKEEPKKPISFQDKIKNMQGGEKPKKEETKEQPKKPNPFADKIKNFGGGNTNPSASSTNKNPAIHKPHIPAKDDSSAKIFPKDNASKKGKAGPEAGSFGSKLNKMSEMFKNRGMPHPGAKRPSMMIGMPQNFQFGKGGPNTGGFLGGAKTINIIREEPDKMKAGYDPALTLQKTLDSVVVVKKDKRKKKKPVTFNG